MMFLKSALTLVLASSASAFFVPNRITARPFVSSHQVSLSSEPTVSTDAAAEPEENATAPPAVEEVSASEEAAPVQVSASEEAAPVKKVVEQKDRHTIYIGNLPFGRSPVRCRCMGPILFSHRLPRTPLRYDAERIERDFPRTRGMWLHQHASQ